MLSFDIKVGEAASAVGPSPLLRWTTTLIKQAKLANWSSRVPRKELELTTFNKTLKVEQVIPAKALLLTTFRTPGLTGAHTAS